MPEARYDSDDTDEKTTITDVGEALAQKVGLILGEDDQGREHVHWPARNEISVRERSADDTHETVEEVDLGAKTVADYRVFVEEHVDDCDVDWNEAAF